MQYDGKLSDNMKVQKIVHMRNILTGKRQWCKVNTDKKTGMTHEKQGLCVIFSAVSFAYEIFCERKDTGASGPDPEEKTENCPKL